MPRGGITGAGRGLRNVAAPEFEAARFERHIPVRVQATSFPTPNVSSTYTSFESMRIRFHPKQIAFRQGIRRRAEHVRHSPPRTVHQGKRCRGTVVHYFLSNVPSDLESMTFLDQFDTPLVECLAFGFRQCRQVRSPICVRVEEVEAPNRRATHPKGLDQHPDDHRRPRQIVVRADRQVVQQPIPSQDVLCSCS